MTAPNLVSSMKARIRDGDRDHQGEGDGQRSRQLAGGDRSVSLDRVGAVALGVAGVVEQVCRAARRAEESERRPHWTEQTPGRAGLVQCPQLVDGEEQGQEDEQVLGPLARTHGPDDCGRGSGEFCQSS